jgi:hypothetical protein
MKKKLYLKIFIGLTLAFIVASVTGNTVFIASTPKVNPKVFYTFNEAGFQINYKLASVFHKKINKNSDLSVSDRIAQIEQKAQSLPLSKVAKGVYAQSTDQGTVFTVKTNEVIWEKHTYLIDGKNITIYVEQGKTPPTSEEVRKNKVFYQ